MKFRILLIFLTFVTLNITKINGKLNKNLLIILLLNCKVFLFYFQSWCSSKEIVTKVIWKL